MNAKLASLVVSALLGAAGAAGLSISAGWGLLATVLMYGIGGSLSLFAASMIIVAAEAYAPERPAHA